MKTGLNLLFVLMLGVSFGILVPVTQIFLESKREAQRWQDCTSLDALPIKIGDRLLTVPVLDNTDVRIHGHNMAKNVQSEEAPNAEPGAPLVFCVPAVLGAPPYEATTVSLHEGPRSKNFGLDSSSDLSNSLSAFGPVYGVKLHRHRDDWDSIVGKSLRSLAEPDGRMTVRRTQQDRFGSFDVLAYGRTPDQNGFRYAARCVRWEFPKPNWSCNLTVVDDVIGIDYSRALYYIPDDVDLWTEAESVPQSFVDFALDMRRLVKSLETPSP